MTRFYPFLRFLTGAAILVAPFSVQGASDVPETARTAQIIFLGEQHDNPDHHAVQAAWVAALAPRALVFEMLTPEQAALVTPQNRVDAVGLEAVLGWNASGWPDFAMYYPIFAAAPEAEIFGAGVPRDRVRALMQEDLAQVVDPETATRFGLDAHLPPDQQVLREDLQRSAHCDALPEELLPRMVSVQRLRDAALADAALDALERLGGPVVVITGNGHAREDWGAPFLLRQAADDVKIFSLGQGEAGQMPPGGFAATRDAAAVDRGDPCDAFR